jgi:hypothetical protein
MNIIIILIIILIIIIFIYSFSNKTEILINNTIIDKNIYIPKVIYLTYKTKNIPDHIIPKWN